MDFAAAQRILKSANVSVAPGLTADEFARVEREFGFRFPPDLREFLSMGLPDSGHWVDWRNGNPAAIRARLAWPLEGICFDIERNAFWLDQWGTMPKDLNDALRIAQQAVADAPPLIPIFSHRYLPACPTESGNPVLSVYGTDIIYYGSNLLDYFQNEFRNVFGRLRHQIAGKPREIPFWSCLVS
jgi:hypothetical protein